MLNLFSVITHPQIDPVLISLGPLQVHWYGVAYVMGILFGWWYAKKLVTTNRLWAPANSPITDIDIDDFLIWAVGGIILGGRIGYILFYDLPTYLDNPLAVFAVWQGGMSFHGGLAGIIFAMILFARRRGFSPYSLFDVIAASCGLGIFLGRVSNFINGELYGRVSDAPWAVIFPNTDGLARHPSQLYEGHSGRYHFVRNPGVSDLETRQTAASRLRWRRISCRICHQPYSGGNRAPARMRNWVICSGRHG